jgi:predicted MPP superfamily phosphohydrolase
VELRQQPRRHSLARRAFVRAVECGWLALGGRQLYRARHLRRPGLELRHETVRAADLPPELHGVRIVQLSDLHAGAFVGRGDLRHVVAQTERLAPDVVALTGDFITHAPEELELILPDLAQLRATRGVFAVFGNHDYRGRCDAKLAERLASIGVRVLRNECARLEFGAATLCLVGVEDLEESKHVDLAAARAAVGADEFEVVLCHHPALAPHAVRPRCLAVLSGHTHGTQVDLPFLRRAGPPHPGARLELGPTRLIVSRGLGAIGLPLRFRAPSEIVSVTLERS